ncbi:MAG: MerR family DNA-binding protein [Idiomarina sp.]
MVQSQDLTSFTIGRLAAAANVGVETVRFYQRNKLLAVPPFVGKVRQYGMQDLRRLRFIKRAQLAGFSLKQIKQLLDLDATHDRAQVRELANSRLQELEEKIAELVSARNALQRLASECKHGSSGPCPIIESFEAGEPG